MRKNYCRLMETTHGTAGLVCGAISHRPCSDLILGHNHHVRQIDLFPPDAIGRSELLGVLHVGLENDFDDPLPQRRGLRYGRAIIPVAAEVMA